MNNNELFSNLPSNWDKLTFKDATSIITDFTANGSFESLRLNVKYYYDNNYARLIRLVDLRQKLINDGVYVDKSGYEYLKKSSLLENDILLANVGEYTGYTCLMPKVNYLSTLGPNMFLIRFKEMMAHKYTYYYMCHFLFSQQVDQICASSATKLLNKTNFRKLRLISPPLPEQQKIAEVLTTIDNVIEKTEQLIEKLKSIKKGLMQDLFTRGVTPDGKLRPTPEDAPELYKESELGLIPKEWEVDQTKSLSKRIWIGLVTTMTKHYVDTGVKLIRNNNIKDSRITDKEIIYLDNSFAEQNRNRYLQIGDIVTVHTGDIGTSAIITDEFNNSHGFATINTRTDDTIIINRYLSDYFNSSLYKDRIQAYATGDGRSNFNLYDFVYIKIPYPKDIIEQEAICDIISSLRNQIDNENDYLNKLLILKKGLMDDLLTGKVRVTELLKDEI